ncbi:response regulator [Alloacidobacterium sp.]|uniref:response regulator n=1 Tax=Alloacidobacterium sp. TaxID=2951999 RepID=UPI002D44818E|nr:response regulator [Alloacidobacterium sp.]HYK35593.1 response regulator [Alloacidobacterium sp.]
MSRETTDVIRILIADDHPVVRAGLASMLATYPDLEVVGSVPDGNQTISTLVKKQVDILLLDLRMPALNGIETLRALKQLKSPPRVIVLTSYESDDDVYEAIRAGAHGYLLKASSVEEMIDAIHDVHAGERHFPPHIAARFADRVPRAHLDQEQRSILDLISEGMTDTQVAEKVGLDVAEVWERLNAIIETLDAAEEARANAAQGRRVTISDIARKAGVSMATVSRVLHNSGKHSEETRRAVMKVVSEYDFQLNDNAASLAMMRNTSQS